MSIVKFHLFSNKLAASIVASLILFGVASSTYAKSAVNTSPSNASLRSVSTLSLQNLERERAALIQDLLNPEFSLEQRALQLSKRQRQLTDMERMVMRDERLTQSDSAHVKRAFEDYDSTFLVHAGAESQRSAAEQWLSTVNISNRAIMNTRMGFRK